MKNAAFYVRSLSAMAAVGTLLTAGYASASSSLVIDNFNASFDTINGVAPGPAGDFIALSPSSPVGTATYSNTTLLNAVAEDAYSAELTATLTSGGGGTTIRLDAGGLGLLSANADAGSTLMLTIEYTFNSPANWAQYAPDVFVFDFLQFQGQGQVTLTVDGDDSSVFGVASAGPAAQQVFIPVSEVGGDANLSSISSLKFNLEYILPNTDSVLDDLELSLSLTQGVIPSPAAAGIGLVGVGGLVLRRRR